jgi:hypothetical protein
MQIICRYMIGRISGIILEELYLSKSLKKGLFCASNPHI